MRIFTNLDLHEDTPIRVQPMTGEWGPVNVMPTKRKKRTRWMWVVAFAVMTTILIVFAWWVYNQLMAL
ncbi:MAG: hypothetical protein FWD55_04990 [Propionibacteriaceae bacterium]|nr:hypothetical protein [Propionibacteriaceae bacterium]